MNIEFIGLIAGFLTTVAAIPQIIKSYQTKEVKDISLFMFVAVVAGVALWLIYGIFLGAISIIFWNVVALVLDSTILIQKIYYSQKALDKWSDIAQFDRSQKLLKQNIIYQNI